jgi:hypothetical protein
LRALLLHGTRLTAPHASRAFRIASLDAAAPEDPTAAQVQRSIKFDVGTAVNLATDVHVTTCTELEQRFGTSRERGLTAEAAARRLAEVRGGG